MSRTRTGERIRVNFYFDADVAEGLKKLAELLKMTYSEVIRAAAREYLVREGSKAIEAGQIMRDVK